MNNNLDIKIDENDKISVICKGVDITGQHPMDDYLNLLNNNCNYYKRTKVLDTSLDTTYNFYSMIEDNDVTVTLSKLSSFNLAFSKGDSIKEQLDRITEKINTVIKEREKKQKKVKFAKDALLSAVTIVGIAGTIVLTSFGVQTLKEDMALSKTSQTNSISYSQGYQGPPDGYISNELQAERDEAKNKYYQEQRAYEESMVNGALEPENANKTK